MMASSGGVAAAGRIDLAETADFDLGAMRFSPARREARLDGQCRELEPRVAQVLVALASARPNVVSRDRLIDQCWDGRTVSDDALNRCIVALRHLARDFSPEPFAIKTVPRVGYSLVECVPDAPPATDNPATPGTDSALQSAGVGQGSRPLRVWIMFAVAAAAAALILAIVLWRSGAQEGPASIAVLPFRNLAAGEPYFAEGVSEEILGQLSREPQFRVAGSGSTRQFGRDPDIGEIARRLDVAYVLQGSVRRQANRVRVSANLVRTSDGTRLWAESYDGTLDDVFAIQRRIGSSIAGALTRKLIREPVKPGLLVTNGEAYNLYLTARGLIRTRQSRVGQTAVDLLRDAIKLDPQYAPAWASLAEATLISGGWSGFESYVGAVRDAKVYARHALKLAPDLAEAHRALGRVLGLGNPEALAHFRRAAELEPNNAENLIGLGTAYGAAGDFEQELALYRRAHALDPLWWRAVGSLATALADMGNRAEAEAVVRHSSPKDTAQKHTALGRVAWILGDFSEAARHWSIAAQANSPRWSASGRGGMKDALFAVGLATEPAPPRGPRPIDDRHLRGVGVDTPPSASLWQTRNRDAIAAEVYRAQNIVAAKRMLNAGRVRELADTYDSPIGLLRVRPGQALRVDQLSEAPIVALVLRLSGREAQADRLLREADAAARATVRRGKVPFWFDVDVAAVRAVQGRKDEALTMIERAVGRGWLPSGGTNLRDIADDPAFRSLHGQPRFEAVRARIAAHLGREKREMARLAR